MKKAKIYHFCQNCKRRHVLIVNVLPSIRISCPCCGAHEDLNYNYECTVIEEYQEKTNKKGVKKQ